MKTIVNAKSAARPLARWLAATLALAAAVAQAASPGAKLVKDPLYGDPKHPNIAGMWTPDFLPYGEQPAANPAPRPVVAPPQLTPAYAARYAEWRKKLETGTQEPDTVTRCLAFGIARFGTMPVEIIQTPGQVTLNVGVLHDIRRIYMDGIGHTIGADPSFNGDSVGRWEGDTLVVETNNLRAATLDINGVPYSDQLTVVERIRLTAPGRLEFETTLTDPEALLAPYTIRRTYVPMARGSRFEEYVCENNRD